MKFTITLAGILSVTLALTPPAVISAQEADKQSDGIAVQSRGPVHEAFAELVDPTPRPGPIVPKKPPDPIPEVPPDEKPEGDNVQWVPGYWAWDSEQNNYLWVSGVWRVPPLDRQWVPGYWSETQQGWQWTPGLWAPAQQQQPDYVPEPPPDSLDNGPRMPAPDENSFYVPGNWMYQSTGYVWRPGYWTAIRPGYCWTPAHYCWTPAGYCYVNGYWDYPLEDRGLLFAPVVFTEPLWSNPNWFYRPSYCIDLRGLLWSLFCRPRYCHYYFGDFFDQGYYTQGFYPWFAYGRRWHSPLFGYYNWQHRGERGWFNGLVRDYRARRAGDLPRTPRTLVTPLHDLRSHGIRLTHVDAAQVSAARQRTASFNSRSVERQRVERTGTATTFSSARVPGNRPVARPPLPNLAREHAHASPATSSQPQRVAEPSIRRSTARPNAELHAQPHRPATVGHSPPADIRPRQPAAAHQAAPTGHHERPRRAEPAVDHDQRASSRAPAQPHRSAPARSAAPRNSDRATPHPSAPAHHAAPASQSGGGGGHDKKTH
jgi:hypothetical protein